MNLLKKMLKNEALSFILIMLIGGFLIWAFSGDLHSLLQTLLLCWVFWAGVGLAILREGMVIKEYGRWNPPSFIFEIVIRAILLGPFAHRIFR